MIDKRNKMMTVHHVSFDQLERRREQLGMSCAALAHRSGLSLPTVQRILSGKHPNASLANVVALTQALGFDIKFESTTDPDDLQEQQAHRKAEGLVGMVQGSSALEGQALDGDTLQKMVKKTARELLTGSKRKLWAD